MWKIGLFRCGCGYLYMRFSEDLFYGPLNELMPGRGFAEFMNMEEFCEFRPDCGPVLVCWITLP